MGKIKDLAEQESLRRFAEQESKYFSDQSDKFEAEAAYFKEKAATAIPHNLDQALIIIKELREEQINSTRLRSKWKEYLLGFVLGIAASVIATLITT